MVISIALDTLLMELIEPAWAVQLQDARYELSEMLGLDQRTIFFLLTTSWKSYPQAGYAEAQDSLWIFKYSEILQAFCETISLLKSTVVVVFKPQKLQSW